MTLTLSAAAAAAGRLARARLSLDGVALGDAFGERFFVPTGLLERLIAERALPGPPWPFTDDTQMALSVVGTLARFGRIDQDWLASSFGEHYHPARGYGMAMHNLLPAIRAGAPWREAAALFGGQGSFGNGAAMRVAPLGANFADDPDLAAEQAALSATVTHTHPEGVAGAVAVAVAAARACRWRGERPRPSSAAWLERIVEQVPPGQVRSGIQRAIGFGPGASVRDAVAALGSGDRVAAQDTVPFALWCAARHLDDYEAALWATVSGLGDRDTSGALSTGRAARAGADRAERLPGLPAATS
jgi:ADP-ribosylglycohydrolase